MILDGKNVANKYKEFLLKEFSDKKASLHIIHIGDDVASDIYLKTRIKLGNDLGVSVICHGFDNTADTNEILELIDKLNHEPSCTGIMIDRPIPKNIDEERICREITYLKDIDGCSDINYGRLTKNLDCLVPATAQAVIDLLTEYKINLVGVKACVIGRSKTIGRPIAELLINANSTVTICHSKTINLFNVVKENKLVVVAIGKPKFINEDYIKNDHIIVDVGIHRDEEGKMCGDVSKDVYPLVDSYSPVPGGVGPLTTIELFKNLLKAYNLQNGKRI